jgi:integrase
MPPPSVGVQQEYNKFVWHNKFVVPRLSPKVLRHTVAEELRRRGIPDWEVSGQSGHKKGEDQ